MARSSWAPSSSYTGFYTWHGVLTAAVSNKALTTNVATLTTSTAHGFVAGDTVTVTGVSGGFNGTWTIIAAPTPTTFTFALIATDVVSTAVSPVGSATVAAGGRAVTDLPDGLTVDDYNVPGNVNYDADVAIDTVVKSVEDPTS
jgi:hypothetical protein